MPLPKAIEGQDVAVYFPITVKVIVAGRHLVNDGDAVSISAQGAR
jgi:hypothetical protein